ncbi:hypothetical protein BU26DRAFT_111156 [Trematosphaeria pertusa]|uniref:Uncharacterized protein n=1 Tax=Trematosphaeria pertusa TaxID=390896 RepID=A0A6A6I0C3_9PLEO|nr:uncharacterized protein BU26DRAFT_111156 [Trematosphaeria pertusa]KAF2243944.1 hypothetical protein BU26DRAFT_111156 [Trematosphaeria pertusa]
MKLSTKASSLMLMGPPSLGLSTTEKTETLKTWKGGASFAVFLPLALFTKIYEPQPPWSSPLKPQSWMFMASSSLDPFTTTKSFGIRVNGRTLLGGGTKAKKGVSDADAERCPRSRKLGNWFDLSSVGLNGALARETYTRCRDGTSAVLVRCINLASPLGFIPHFFTSSQRCLRLRRLKHQDGL